MSGLPQQPYFLRALYEWCVDSGYTPYATVKVDSRTRVPKGFVKDGQIVLNIGPNAVRNLHMDNDWLTFSARFGGMAQNIEVPVGNVTAIYAQETGEGMGFGDGETAQPASDAATVSDADATLSDGPSQPPKGKPQLRVVK
ncbi:MAG: ClpXP protease specificity-enhancing factor [Betaproteobacteria bacterium]|nr:ClpXP protease specificity-enhancing factor [Betaproteobacteria bacterium]